MIAIKPFEPIHAAGVVSVILPIQQDEFGIPITLAAQPDIQDIARFYQRGNGNFWVALDDEKVVGTTALLDIGDRQCALRKMFVSAAFRGAEHGVAKKLLAELLNWCVARDVRDIFLGTTDKFLTAHRFYEKNNFKSIDRDQLPVTFPIMTVDTKFYRLTLGRHDAASG